jgi:hypothetical protein
LFDAWIISVVGLQTLLKNLFATGDMRTLFFEARHVAGRGPWGGDNDVMILFAMAIMTPS